VAHPIGVEAVKQLADAFWLLSGFPPNAINVYLVDDVLIDAGTRHAGRRILRQLKGRELSHTR
jgi:hydroxyacylglutathione hydrolase